MATFIYWSVRDRIASLFFAASSFMQNRYLDRFQARIDKRGSEAAWEDLPFDRIDRLYTWLEVWASDTGCRIAAVPTLAAQIEAWPEVESLDCAYDPYDDEIAYQRSIDQEEERIAAEDAAFDLQLAQWEGDGGR